MNTPNGNVMIESLGVGLPETFISARELIAGCQNPVDFDLASITGITEVPKLPPGKYAQHLAEQAVGACLATSRHAPGAVDLVIACTLLNHNAPRVVSLEPPMSSVIKQRFGFDAALTFDVSCACAGLFVGLRVAGAFLRSGAIRTALIYAGEHVTHVFDTAQQVLKSGSDPHLPCLTVGDSGAALMLELGSDPELGLRDFQLLTLGRYSNHCVAQPYSKPPGGILMRTDTVRLALVTCREGMAHFERSQRAGKFDGLNFDFFVPHQASSATLAGVMRDTNRRFGADTLTERNTINNLAHRGNTVTTTHFVAIHDAMREGRIKSGSKLLLSTVASGATIGSAAYYLDDLPERRSSAPPVIPPAAQATDVQAWHGRLARPVRLLALCAAPPDVPDSRTLSLAKAAARASLLRSEVPRHKLAWLVFAGVYKSDFVVEPAIAAFLAGELRVNDSSADSEHRTLAFDLNDGANGFLAACHVIARLLELDPTVFGMAVTGEGDVPYESGSPAVAAAAHAAILGSSDDRSGLLEFGVYEFPALLREIKSEVRLLEQGGAVLHRTAVPFDYTTSVDRALDLFFQNHEGLSEAVDYLLLPQVAPDYAARVPGRFGLKHDCRVLLPAEELHSSTLPAQIIDLEGKLAPKPGALALFVSAGAGVKVSCASYRY